LITIDLYAERTLALHSNRFWQLSIYYTYIHCDQVIHLKLTTVLAAWLKVG